MLFLCFTSPEATDETVAAEIPSFPVILAFFCQLTSRTSVLLCGALTRTPSRTGGDVLSLALNSSLHCNCMGGGGGGGEMRRDVRFIAEAAEAEPTRKPLCSEEGGKMSSAFEAKWLPSVQV